MYIYIYIYTYRIDPLLSILLYVHIVYFHSLFLKSVSKRWHIHDILRNITSFHLNWCVSWGSWPISLPWISIPERWQIELTMFFCRFAELILKNFFSGGIVELIKMVQEVTSTQVQKWLTVGQGLWSRNSAASSIACHWHWQYLGLRSYVYIYNLECFDIHWKKTAENSPRSLDHIGSYWIIDPSNSATLGRSLP